MEIAGLVLGGFPLLISAAENYRKGFEPLQEWWKFDSHFSNFIEELVTEQNRFDLNLERLLSPFISSASLMHALLNERSPEAWGNKTLQKDVEERLGSSYEPYLAICRKMNDILGRLQKLLGVGKENVDYIDASTWDHELFRLRVSFSRGKVKDVQRLEKYNDKLRDLVTSNDALGPSRRTRHITPFMDSLRIIRQHSQTFYSVLKSRWICDCSTFHESKICLDMHHEEQSLVNTTLRVLFETSSMRMPVKVCTDVPNMKYVQSTEVIGTNTKAASELLDLRDQIHQRANPIEWSPSPNLGMSKAMLQSGLAITTMPQPLVAGSVLKKPGKIKAPRVTKNARFIDSTHSAKNVAGPTTAHTTCSRDSSQRQNVSEIRDICSEMRGWSVNSTCLGYLATSATTKNQMFIYSDSQRAELEHGSRTASLEHILSGSQCEDPNETRLTRKERLVFAWTLASAMLRLQPTSWLPSKWGKRDILLISATPDRFPAATDLYISKTFPSGSFVKTESIRECRESLQCLGIIILELIFNRSLESLPFRQRFLDNGNSNEFTDYCTAQKWQEQVEGECGPDIAEVVRRCIDCSFGPQPNWDSPEFVGAYRAQVLEPLHEIVKPWRKSTQGNAGIGS